MPLIFIEKYSNKIISILFVNQVYIVFFFIISNKYAYGILMINEYISVSTLHHLSTIYTRISIEKLRRCLVNNLMKRVFYKNHCY